MPLSINRRWAPPTPKPVNTRNTLKYAEAFIDPSFDNSRAEQTGSGARVRCDACPLVSSPFHHPCLHTSILHQPTTPHRIANAIVSNVDVNVNIYLSVHTYIHTYHPPSPESQSIQPFRYSDPRPTAPTVLLLLKPLSVPTTRAFPFPIVPCRRNSPSPKQRTCSLLAFALRCGFPPCTSVLQGAISPNGVSEPRLGVLRLRKESD